MKTRFRLWTVLAVLVGILSTVGVSLGQELEINESVVTLDNGVVGTLTIPEVEGPMPAVLMLHGFASSRDEVGDMYGRLSDELSARGIASLRIDFRGWGESGGEMTESSVTGMVEDAALAYDYLAAQDFVDPERIGLIGFSLGGGVAIFSAGENPDNYASLALWSTFGDLHEVFLESLEQENFDTAAAEGQVEIDLGWRMVTLGNVFFESLDDYNYEAAFPNYTGDFLVVAGSEDGSADFLDWYRENAQGSIKASYLVDGADHIYNVLTDDQTNANSVIETTADWFAMTL